MEQVHVIFVSYVMVKMLILQYIPLDINFACEHVQLHYAIDQLC
jgi:hypothetical protein